LALLLLVLGDLQHLLLPVIDRILPFRRSEISGRRAARRNRINTDAGWNILKEVQRIADVTGAEVFAISGTLLGIHRNGGLLAHDVDIDVGIHLDDPRLDDFLRAMVCSPLTRRAKSARLGAITRYLNPHLPLMPDHVIYHTFYMEDPSALGETVSVDVFLHFRALGFDVHGIGTRLWINSPIVTERVQVKDAELLLPRDRHTYLLENYGDYRVERKVFENAVDCPNAVNLYAPGAAVWMISKLNLYYRAGWFDRYTRLRLRHRDMVRGLLRGRRVTPQWRIEDGLNGRD
jgi:hypothetical protein